MTYINGRSTPTAPQPDHTAILVHMSGQLGEVRADVKAIKQRQQEIEQTVKELRPKTSIDWPAVAVAAALLGAAAAGKVTWAEALPSITQLVGR